MPTPRLPRALWGPAAPSAPHSAPKKFPGHLAGRREGQPQSGWGRLENGEPRSSWEKKFLMNWTIRAFDQGCLSCV